MSGDARLACKNEGHTMVSPGYGRWHCRVRSTVLSTPSIKHYEFLLPSTFS